MLNLNPKFLRNGFGIKSYLLELKASEFTLKIHPIEVGTYHFGMSKNQNLDYFKFIYIYKLFCSLGIAFNKFHLCLNFHA